MAKVILLEKPTARQSPQLTFPVYVQAALRLSLAALWPFEQVKTASLLRCKDFITDHLVATTDTKAAFTNYCERILIFCRMLELVPDFPLDGPAIWLNPANEEGYMATRNLSRLMQTEGYLRKPHLQGIAAFIEGYRQYLEQPTPPVLSRLHDKLYRLKQYNLLRVLGHIILQQSLGIKQRA